MRKYPSARIAINIWMDIICTLCRQPQMSNVDDLAWFLLFFSYFKKPSLFPLPYNVKVLAKRFSSRFLKKSQTWNAQPFEPFSALLSADDTNSTFFFDLMAHNLKPHFCFFNFILDEASHFACKIFFFFFCFVAISIFSHISQFMAEAFFASELNFTLTFFHKNKDILLNLPWWKAKFWLQWKWEAFNLFNWCEMEINCTQNNIFEPFRH